MKRLQTLGVIAGIALAGVGVVHITNKTAPVNANTEMVERIHHNADWVKIEEDENGWIWLGRLVKEAKGKYSKGDEFNVKLVYVVTIEDGQVTKESAMSLRCIDKTIAPLADGNQLPVAKGTISEAIFDAFCS
tara:strand:- start:554 stop:952 length:399 start_codon:yes stop_codon:yes gene_type:complete